MKEGSDSDVEVKSGLIVATIKNPFLVHSVLISVQLCFSGWHIVGSLALKKGADALMFALYREILASALMFALVRRKGRTVQIENKDLGRIVFLGFCSFINVVGTVLALQYISAVRYSVMQPIIPVIATLISVAIGLEYLTPIKCLGILAAVGGAILVETWHADGDDGSKNVVLGTILVCVQVTAMASLIVFQKPLLSRYDPAVLTFLYYGVGSVFTVLMSLCWASRFVASDFYFSGHMLPWLALAYATIFATLYAYNAYSWAGKRVSPAITTVYNTLQPVGTCLLSFIIMGTVVNIAEVLGGLLVMLGLVITVYGRQKELKTYPPPLRAVGGTSYAPVDMGQDNGDRGAGRGNGESSWVLVDDVDAPRFGRFSVKNSTAPM